MGFFPPRRVIRGPSQEHNTSIWFSQQTWWGGLLISKYINILLFSVLPQRDNLMFSGTQRLTSKPCTTSHPSLSVMSSTTLHRSCTFWASVSPSKGWYHCCGIPHQRAVYTLQITSIVVFGCYSSIVSFLQMLSKLCSEKLLAQVRKALIGFPVGEPRLAWSISTCFPLFHLSFSSEGIFFS